MAKPRLLATLVLMLCWAALIGAAPGAIADDKVGSKVRISLLAINDFHGNIMPPGIAVPVPDAAGPAGVRVSAGGAAYLSTLVRQQKALNPGNTLVVGAGDLLGATPLVSGLFHDEPTVEVLNQIGLDISSVGNHEFDKGTAEILRLQNGGCYPRNANGGSGVVGVDTCLNQGRFEGARYRYLAANVIVKATGKALFPAYAIRDVDGVRIGFIGLTLRGTPAMVMPSGVAGLEFRDEVRTINALVPELKAQGVTVFVLLIHQGGHTTAQTALDKTCPDFSGDILDIADRLDPAVQVVISGHTHQEYVCTRPDGRLITQSGFYGRLLTRIDLMQRDVGDTFLSNSTRKSIETRLLHQSMFNLFEPSEAKQYRVTSVPGISAHSIRLSTKLEIADSADVKAHTIVQRTENLNHPPISFIPFYEMFGEPRWQVDCKPADFTPSWAATLDLNWLRLASNDFFDQWIAQYGVKAKRAINIVLKFQAKGSELVLGFEYEKTLGFDNSKTLTLPSGKAAGSVELNVRSADFAFVLRQIADLNVMGALDIKADEHAIILTFKTSANSYQCWIPACDLSGSRSTKHFTIYKPAHSLNLLQSGDPDDLPSEMTDKEQMALAAAVKKKVQRERT